MNCTNCDSKLPENANFCPDCGVLVNGSENLDDQKIDSAGIEIEETAVEPTTDIKTEGGAYIDGSVSTKGGDFIGRDQVIQKLIERFEQKIVQGDYVERQEISNTLVLAGNIGLEEITAWLTKRQGLDKGQIASMGSQAAPEHINLQIQEIQAAEQETAAQGLSLSPQAAYRLGMLAAYRRDYEPALNYFQQATTVDPGFRKGYKATVWLQQSLAMADIQKADYETAVSRLASAQAAASQTDPLDPEALNLRGYLEKILAQVSEARQDAAGREKHYQEAARYFEHVVQLDPDNAGAHNGLGNGLYALGELDAAIAAYQKAISLVPTYTDAYHDLAISYEAKWRDEPAKAVGWLQKAISAWQETYRLAPNNPGFTADYIVQIGQRIHWLEQQL